MDKEKLKQLILYILNKVGPTPKTKLAKLLLFSEIEYFNSKNSSLTGLYFVRLKNGPVIAFYDEVLEENIDKAWKMEIQHIPILEDGREKEQHLYSAMQEIDLPVEKREIVDKVIKKYAKKSGTELSRLSHELPAWKYSEPNEPIYVVELATKNEKEYFALIDIVEDTDDRDDAFLADKISSSLLPA